MSTAINGFRKTGVGPSIQTYSQMTILLLLKPLIFQDQNIKKSTANILTSTPYKTELEQQVLNSYKAQKGATKKKPKKTVAAKKVNRRVSRSDAAHHSDSDAACLYCSYLYSESTEGWVQCIVCKRWAHCSCAGEEEDDEVVHICEFCKS
nr:unnamed protein product [Callosobruchus chinensis]